MDGISRSGECSAGGRSRALSAERHVRSGGAQLRYTSGEPNADRRGAGDLPASHPVVRAPVAPCRAGATPNSRGLQNTLIPPVAEKYSALRGACQSLSQSPDDGPATGIDRCTRFLRLFEYDGRSFSGTPIISITCKIRYRYGIVLISAAVPQLRPPGRRAQGTTAEPRVRSPIAQRHRRWCDRRS